MVQHGKINCPVCKQDKDSLTVWNNIDRVAFCACDECIASRLPVSAYATTTTRPEKEAILKVGFRAGYDKARQEIKDFLNKKN